MITDTMSVTAKVACEVAECKSDPAAAAMACADDGLKFVLDVEAGEPHLCYAHWPTLAVKWCSPRPLEEFVEGPTACALRDLSRQNVMHLMFELSQYLLEHVPAFGRARFAWTHRLWRLLNAICTPPWSLREDWVREDLIEFTRHTRLAEFMAFVVRPAEKEELPDDVGEPAPEE